MKFIHIADLHLCSSYRTSTLSPEVRQSQKNQLWKTFYNVLELCRKESVDILLISGDLFEAAYAGVSDYKRASDALASIAPTRVFISCGNHDPLSEDSLYNFVEFPKNVHIFPSYFSKVFIPELNTSVYGYSWSKNTYDYTPFPFTRDEDGSFSILCLHADVINTANGYMPTDIKEILTAGYDYSALGHIHKYMMLEKNIAYCGSLEPLNFGEEGEHGLIMGEYQRRSLGLKFVSCAYRKFISLEITISGAMNYNDIKQLIKAAAKDYSQQDVLRIVLRGSLSPSVSVDAIIQDLSDSFFSLSIRNETTSDYDLKKLYEDNADNIIGMYISELNPKVGKDKIAEKALYYGVEALMDSFRKRKA